MNNVWLSALLRDGKNPVVKAIISNNEGEPLQFDTQLNANKFWQEYKDRFEISPKFKDVKVTPQVVREGVPYEVRMSLIENENRVVNKQKGD